MSKVIRVVGSKSVYHFDGSSARSVRPYRVVGGVAVLGGFGIKYRVLHAVCVIRVIGERIRDDFLVHETVFEFLIVEVYDVKLACRVHIDDISVAHSVNGSIVVELGDDFALRSVQSGAHQYHFGSLGVTAAVLVRRRRGVINVIAHYDDTDIRVGVVDVLRNDRREGVGLGQARFVELYAHYRAFDDVTEFVVAVLTRITVDKIQIFTRFYREPAVGNHVFDTGAIGVDRVLLILFVAARESKAQCRAQYYADDRKNRFFLHNISVEDLFRFLII